MFSPGRRYTLSLFILWACLSGGAVSAWGQRRGGELRLAVKDAAGLAVAARVELLSESSNVHQTIQLPPEGRYTFKNLNRGVYQLKVTANGLEPHSDLIHIDSQVPVERTVTLAVQAVEVAVEVRAADTLVDPSSVAATYYVGREQIENRPQGQPGRGLVDLLAMQPGWTTEANGILHPRESEYDMQYVVNGFPLTENRSPAFAPTVEAESVESMKVYASGIPAEFGNKLGGVVEINTDRNRSPGFHGTAVAQGGSFDTAGGYLAAQYVAGRTTSTATAEGFLTDRYLDPPTLANASNHGSSTSVSATVERDVSEADRLRISAAHRDVWFLVPNDLLQEAVGQRQDRTSGSNEGQLSYQHVFSAGLVGAVRGMVRDISARLWSNPLATPIEAHQDRGYREGYVNASLSGHYGGNDWKTGTEARWASVKEQFGYKIVAYDLQGTPVFDDNLPPSFEFRGRAPDREQSVYAQDTLHWRNLTLNAGLRFDHYQLLVDETGFSPRLGASWNLKPLGMVLHASYDRTFGTPPFENILVSASPATRFGSGFYLPVSPSRGNYYEAGFSQSLGGHARLDANLFHRDVRNFEDDDLLLNTGVSFPIAFRQAQVRGLELKLDIPRWGPVSGFLSYSNTIGTGRFPLTGGLFLDNEDVASLASTDRFPISQDVRNSAHTWLRYQLLPRLWTAWSASYSSGLPVEGVDSLPEFDLLVAQYGEAVVRKVNFDRGRVRPSFFLNASFGADLWKTERKTLGVQADVMNITDRLNLINFSGLLSGTAISNPRSAGVRLRLEF